MIPAGGWRAVYAYRETGEVREVRRGKYAHAEPLMALVLAEKEWTTVHENGRQEAIREGRCIVGYDSDDCGVTSPANEADNFIAYLAPGAPIPDSMEQAAKEYVLSHERESAKQESTNEREP